MIALVALMGCNAIYGIDDLTVDSSTAGAGPGSGSGSGPGADCTLDGRIVPHGQSHTFYSAQVHVDCSSVAQERHCADGVLDGDASYAYATCAAPVDFPGGDQAALSVLEFARHLSLHAETQTPQDGGNTLTLHGENVGGYDYVIKEGDQTVSSFESSQWFTATADSRSAWVIVRGNLTIEATQTFLPADRKLFTVVYASGSCTVEGSISMSQRGANHSASGYNIAAAAIRIAMGTFSGVVDPQIPAAGAAGGPGANGADGNDGNEGIDGATGGGASGGGATSGGPGEGRSGDAAAGSSFSGGSGSGAGTKAGNSSQNPTSGAAAPNGGAGSDGAVNSGVTANRAAGGGAGNPGGSGADVGGNASSGADGTGGILVIICEGDFSGSGSITANGADGGDASASGGDGTPAAGGGGGSGGGSITILVGGNDSGPSPEALGGNGGSATSSGGSAQGGRGGNGTARKLPLRP